MLGTVNGVEDGEGSKADSMLSGVFKLVGHGSPHALLKCEEGPVSA